MYMPLQLGIGLKMTASDEIKELRRNVHDAAEFLKAMGNGNRLTILCLLSQSELSVGQLEEALSIRQPTLSQQLAVLREQELVETRREGKVIYYSLASEEIRDIIAVLYRKFCSPEAQKDRDELLTEIGEKLAAAE